MIDKELLTSPPLTNYSFGLPMKTLQAIYHQLIVFILSAPKFVHIHMISAQWFITSVFCTQQADSLSTTS